MTELVDDINDGNPGDDIGTRPGWFVFGGNYDVQVSNGGAVTGTDTPGGSGRGGAAFDAGSPDMYSSATYVTKIASKIGLAVRMVDNSNFVFAASAGTGGSGLRMSKKVAGVLTQLTGEQPVAGNKYRLEVRVNGASSDYELFEDSGGGWVGMPDGPVSIPHSEISGTNQIAGLINDGSNLSLSNDLWDDYAGGALGGGSGPVMLLGSFAA